MRYLKFILISVLVNSLCANNIIKLDMVSVTAQKQEEDLQKVPMSISVFDDIKLEDKKIDTIKDLAPFIPNLMTFPIGGIPSVLNPTLRGLSTLQQSTLVKVPIMVDGVLISGIGGYDATIFDVEKIEILRGPQATLYGAGAEVGIINITTKKPDNETRAKIAIEYGSDNKKQYSFYTSGAIIKDKFYIGIAGLDYKKDGDIKNIITNKIVNNKKNQYGKIHFRYTPTDALKISFITSKSTHDDGALDGNLAYKPKEITSNLDGFSTLDDLSHTLKIDYDFANYKFESITTKKSLEIEFVHDFDFSQATFFHQNKFIDANSITQEFRLSTKKDNYSWLVGLLYDTEDDKYKTTLDKMSAKGLKHIISKQKVSGDSVGIFTNINYNLSSQLTFVGGLRYDSSDKSAKEGNITLKESSSEISPKISLKYQVNKNFMTYATIAKSYSPGSFNTYSTQSDRQSYGPEKLISYEIGTKNSFLENKITLNSAIYYMDIQNLHTIQYENVVNFYISNSAKATSKGFEIELDARVTESLNIYLNYGYNDITFDKFKNAKGDYKGNTKPFAPKYNYSFGGIYRVENGLFINTDIIGYGKIYLDNANQKSRKAYSIINSKFGYESENFDIYLYGKNIFDKDYTTHEFAQFYDIYSKPREIGIQLAYRF